MSTSSQESLPTISDYGLIRRHGVPIATERDMSFIEDYMDRTNIGTYRDNWAEYDITNNRGTSLVFYLISTSLRAYVTEMVYLTFGDQRGSERYTPMRYRDMMVDNYLAAGGDLKTWQYIGTRNIVNDAARATIKGSFQRAGSNVNRAGTVELFPGNPEFLTTIMANPFTRGIHHLLSEYEQDMGKAKMKRVIFITQGRGTIWDSWDAPEFHLVVELYRPGDEGYPDGQTAEGTQTQRR